MDAWNRRIIPFPEMSPAACAHLADTAEATIRRLEAWTLKVPGASRLRVAERHLRKVAEWGSYGRSADELARTARSIQLTLDFFHLSHVLDPDRRGGEMGRELARALRGTLEGDSLDTTPYEFHSQFWLGTLLARSGLRPAIPPPQGKRPDFFVTLDGVEYGVETKRPRSVQSAHRALESAGDQVRDLKQPAILAIDISECLGATALTTGVMGSGFAAADLMQPHFLRIGRELGAYVRDYERSDKFSRVAALIVFARVIAWKQSDSVAPDGTSLLSVEPFNAACSGLLRGMGARLESLLLKGLSELSGSDAERRPKRPQ